MILVILLGLGVWWVIQAILNAIFAKATGDETLGKVIATIVVIVGIAVYAALDS